MSNTDLDLTDMAKDCIKELLSVWLAFERKLSKEEIVASIENQTIQVNSYKRLLINLRQQVIEGSRWIARAASSFDRDHSEIRSLILRHANEEHLDFHKLEKDFVHLGGDETDILNSPKNIGSEALHGYMMYQATLPNPVQLIGAMWIIEGLGRKMATKWASYIEETLKLEDIANFMKYHGENDDDHFETLYQVLNSSCQTKDDINKIVKCAKVVARLYILQLSEIDNV